MTDCLEFLSLNGKVDKDQKSTEANMLQAETKRVAQSLQSEVYALISFDRQFLILHTVASFQSKLLLFEALNIYYETFVFAVFSLIRRYLMMQFLSSNI